MFFNPFVPGFTDDPYPHYAELREQAPVHEHPMGFWHVSRHADVTALLRANLSVELRNLGPSTDYGNRTADGASMLDRDPPDHTRLRSLVTKAFTPRAISRLEHRVTVLVDRALDRIADAGTADLVEELAFPLPFTVISEMLGMPPANEQHVRDLTGTLVRALEPVPDAETANAIAAADHALAALVADAITWKRSRPSDDLLTALINAEHDNDVLTDAELIAQVVLLYVAGHETTVNLISNGTVALLRNPTELKRLRENPTLITTAVEELLRYDSPVQSTRRVTLAPHEVNGHVIPKGSFVMLSLASANRDPAFWGPNADTLTLDRPNAHLHTSFGAGPHHCLGAALARLEGRTALGRLVTRFPTLSQSGDITWNGRINLRGASSVPISV